MTQKEGRMAVEATHEGISDDELKPEEFSQAQMDVLAQLDPDTQEKIRKGYPIIIGDLTAGNSISFNLQIRFVKGGNVKKHIFYRTTDRNCVVSDRQNSCLLFFCISALESGISIRNF